MLDLAELTWGRYMGGAVVPTGSYVNLRTMCFVQSASDQTLPADGTFHRVGTAGNESAATLATTLNTALGTTFVGGSLHACGSPDNIFSPGQASNDA